MQYLSQRLVADSPEARDAKRSRPAASIGAIVKRAGVSSATFFEHFRDKEGCFLVAYEMIDEHVRGAMQLLAATLRLPDAPGEADLEVRNQILMGGIAPLITRSSTPPSPNASPSFLPTSSSPSYGPPRASFLLFEN